MYGLLFRRPRNIVKLCNLMFEKVFYHEQKHTRRIVGILERLSNTFHSSKVLE
jgi:hypothetical protein